MPLYNMKNQKKSKLKKTNSYDKPYTAEEIEKKYGKDKKNTLLKDPWHKYKADTDIELIHKEPTEKELDKIWNNWNLMSAEQKKESDNKSIELFSVDNKTQYDQLKKEYNDKKYVLSEAEFQIQLESVINDNNIGSHVNEISKYQKNINESLERNDVLDALSYALYLSKIKPDNLYEETIIAKVLRDSKPDLNLNKVFDNINDLPYFLPEEIDNMDIFNSDKVYGIVPDELNLTESISIKDWYNRYKATCLTGCKNEYSFLWVNKLKELYTNYDKVLESGNTNKIESHRLSILSLGWNPELPFDVETRKMVTERTRNKLKSKYNFYCVDVSEAYKDLKDNVVLEASATNKEPLFVTLSYSGYMFSNIIKAYTHSKYSHAALGMDSSLKQLYSFNLNDGGRGFSIEGIDSYKKINDKSEIAVFVLFISKNKMKQVKSKIDDFVKSIDKTSYSVLNILGLVAGIDIEKEKSMICSQFVDTILKSIKIDVTDKPSGIVTPNDLYTSTSKLMYKIYDGPVNKYNKTKVDNIITKLKNDNNIHESTFLHEEKTPVITFDEDGNMLIKNMKKLDYEAEYAKCHKLLVTYEKSDNIEGMKYELCKLWFMNILLERKIYDNKKDDKTKYHKARAKILNDFNYYLNYVCKKEPDFNFTEYYNSTPFSDATIKIDKYTLKYGVKLIKSIVIK